MGHHRNGLASETETLASTSITMQLSARPTPGGLRAIWPHRKIQTKTKIFAASQRLAALPHLLSFDAGQIGRGSSTTRKRGLIIVSTTTASERAAKRVHNFNAGPGALPLSVLQRIKEELLDWRGSGMSVMEMSHRSPEFEGINAAAEAGLRKHLAIPDDYAVIFLQGGGSMQFTMAPMNLCLPGKPVDLIHTGTWTAKALGELKKGILHNVAASTEADKFARLPRKDEIKYSPDASYVHMCTNNTIEGTQWTELPETGNVPLVADMSSDIASKPIDVKKFGLIFAGAQKNLGPSGVTVAIIRRDLAERADKNLPTILQYRTFIKEKSLYNTPPTFAIYIVGLVMEWIDAEGGITAIEKRNNTKAKLLYDTIEASNGFYRCPVENSSRSKMNVVFRVAGGNEDIEKQFAVEAAEAGLVGTPGHRSVGGMRVSLYNAVTVGAVETLTCFMHEFQRTRG
jgi:phosphoserine aminotransferase